MLITIRVPESTGRLFYSEVCDDYEGVTKPVTMGMIVKVEHEPDVIEEILKPVIDCEAKP